MRVRSALAAVAVVAFVAAGCGDDDGDAAPTTTSTSTTSSSTTSSSTTTTTSTTTTSTTTTEPPTTTSEPPGPVCEEADALARLDEAIALARLTPAGPWSADIDDNPFAERTTDPEEYASRLALDCGIVVQDEAGRLALASWTGPRIAFLIQATDAPTDPYRLDATFTVGIDSTRGEFVDGEARSVWAGTFDSGETFVIGATDFSLGPVAKDWIAGDRDLFEEITLDSERHAIAALGEAAMRNIGIAEPPMLGSEEGYVMFTSPAGQILVVDVAPTDWFDPMTPRYFSGETVVETIDGVDVRRTDPAEGDNLGFTIGAEWAWACDSFVWILQPPFNGDAEEMRSTVEAVVATEECQPT